MTHGFDLGPLEAEILRLIWETGEAGVDEIHRVLAANREIAYTTVQTVMTRLAAKGLLERRKAGRAHLYRATVPREELTGKTLKELVQRFFGGRTLSAVSFLLGSEELSQADVAELKRLVDRLAEEEGKR
ncbi:MAG TPA: BlaI/MecI/CopY family transcriptional regulator [Symbiobacteriaceae bacterium]|nr:BlaI/MecI/CopY family transcriptional regulator [Symbiobacteriaceae bacterium]